MGFQETIDSALKDPDIRLLGQINISEEEYKELVAYTHDYVRSIVPRTITPVDIYLAAAMVQIAIRAYSDGNYWTCFKEEINLDISASRTTFVGQVFVATLKKYHMFHIEKEAGANNAYVENIKLHAIVPNNYLQGYFDFLYAFYDKNLFRQLPDSIDEDYFELSEFFSSTLKNTGDSFVLQNLDNKPAKTYRLLKATRVLFAQGDSATVSQELQRHLRILDNYYYDGLIQQNGDRFADGFYRWVSTTQSINPKKEGKGRGEAFYKRPYFYIDCNTEDVKLIIPKQKIRNEDYDNGAFVEIKSERFNQTIRLIPYRAFGVIVSEEAHISVPAHILFEKTEITIRTISQRSFSIPKQDYRVFGDDHEETSTLHNGHNYLVVRKNAEVRGTKYSYVNKSYSEWDEYSYDDINDNSVIYINNTPLSTTGSFAAGADFTHVSTEFELYENEKRIQAAYKHPTISFKLSKNALNGSVLLINGKRYPVKSCATIVELPEENDIYGITIVLERIIDAADGLYIIYLDEPAKKPKEICTYVLLRSLRCRTERRRYVFADEAIITVSGNYDIVPINCKGIENGSYYLLPLSDGREYADFSLRIDEHDYTLRIPVMVFKYGFEGKLQSSKLEYIWHADLKNDFMISMPGATEATAFFESGDIKEEAKGTPLGNGFFRFDITSLVQAIRDHYYPYNYIKIKYTDNKPRTLTVYKVLTRLLVAHANVFFDKNGQVVVYVEYEGPDNLLSLRFTASDTKEIVAERVVHNGINIFPELSGDILYTMHMLEVTPDPFGFALEEEIDKPKKGIGAIYLNDISNCTIRLLGASWRGEELNFNYAYWLNNLQRIDECSYIGVLKERKKRNGSRTQYSATVVSNRVLVECIQNDCGTLEIVSVQTEFEEGIYDPVYYDKTQRRYVCSNNLPENDHSRYIAMYDDDAAFKSEIRRRK